MYFKTMNANYICTLPKHFRIKNHDVPDVQSGILKYLATEYAMGTRTAHIAYSVARYHFAHMFHGAGIWCSDGQNLNLAVG
jgi:hypothetical protein